MLNEAKVFLLEEFVIARFSISCYSKPVRYDATGNRAALYFRLSLEKDLLTAKVVDCCYPIRFIGTREELSRTLFPAQPQPENLPNSQ